MNTKRVMLECKLPIIIDKNLSVMLDQARLIKVRNFAVLSPLAEGF